MLTITAQYRAVFRIVDVLAVAANPEQTPLKVEESAEAMRFRVRVMTRVDAGRGVRVADAVVGHVARIGRGSLSGSDGDVLVSGTPDCGGLNVCGQVESHEDGDVIERSLGDRLDIREGV